MITTSPITYRTADHHDILPIAELHTVSWQHNYRNIWPDEYLDHQCFEERKTTWTKRLSEPAVNQHVVVAEDEGQIVGFGCCYLLEHEQHGTLLDNIHVGLSQQGRGIGAEIMKRTATYAMKRTIDQGFYLWVLTANVKSLEFYKNLKGIPRGSEIHTGPAGIKADATKVTWQQCSILEAACHLRSKR